MVLQRLHPPSIATQIDAAEKRAAKAEQEYKAGTIETDGNSSVVSIFFAMFSTFETTVSVSFKLCQEMQNRDDRLYVFVFQDGAVKYTKVPSNPPIPVFTQRNAEPGCRGQALRGGEAEQGGWDHVLGMRK